MSPFEIAQKEEHRQAVAVAELADDAIWIAGGSVCFSGVGSWMNQAQGLGHNGPVSADEVDQLVEFFTSRSVEPKIEVSVFADASLLQQLDRHGFTVTEFENVWGRDLTQPIDAKRLLTYALPDELSIREVDREDLACVEEFARTSASGFSEDSNAPSPELVEDIKRTVLHERSVSLLARMGGQAAGAAGMEVSGEISCLFGATVLPKFRRRSIQSALIIHRLQKAKSAGCELAVIHSAPGIATERNAQRMGFFLAYSKVIMHMRGEGLMPSP